VNVRLWVGVDVSDESTRKKGGNGLVRVGDYFWSWRLRGWLEAGRLCCRKGLVGEKQTPLEEGVSSTKEEERRNGLKKD